jgi:hypothetical protein
MFGHVEMHNPSAIMVEHDEYIKHSKSSAIVFTGGTR